MLAAPEPTSRIGPCLAQARKDLVTTALGSARLWVTVGQGIVTEVYWPSAGEPQIRDLGFLVAGDGWWSEVKAREDYLLELPDPAVPLGTVVHSGPPEHPYRLDIEVLPDPERDALLVRFGYYRYNYDGYVRSLRDCRRRSDRGQVRRTAAYRVWWKVAAGSCGGEDRHQTR